MQTQPKTQLKVHTNPAPQGLLDIRKMFGDAKHMPGYVYANLNDKERTALCFAAGLKRTDIDKSWHEFTADQRQTLRGAFMLLSGIVDAFKQANATDPKKWLDGAVPNEPALNEGSLVCINSVKEH